MSSYLHSAFALARGATGSACPLGSPLQGGVPFEKLLSVQILRADTQKPAVLLLPCGTFSAASSSCQCVGRARGPGAGPHGLLAADMFDLASSRHQSPCLGL